MASLSPQSPDGLALAATTRSTNDTVSFRKPKMVSQPSVGFEDAILQRREAELRKREERWLSDVEELIHCGRKLASARSSDLHSGTASERSLNIPSGVLSSGGTGSEHGGNSSDCGSSMFDQSSNVSEESLKWRLQSVRFLAWQQSQLGEDLARHQQSLRASRQDLLTTRSDTISREAELSMRKAKLQQEENRFLAAEASASRQVMQRWQDLDAAEDEIHKTGKAMHEKALICEEQAKTLVEAQSALVSAERQLQQLRSEVAALADQRQELDTREAVLHCMEGAWACGVECSMTNLVSVNGGTANGDAHSSRDVLDALREDVATRIVDKLLHSDPQLVRSRKALLAAVHSSVGGPLLNSSAKEIHGSSCEEHRAVSSHLQVSSEPTSSEAPGWETSASMASTRLDEGNCSARLDADLTSDADNESTSAPLPSKSQLVGLDSFRSASSTSFSQRLAEQQTFTTSVLLDAPPPQPYEPASSFFIGSPISQSSTPLVAAREQRAPVRSSSVEAPSVLQGSPAPHTPLRRLQNYRSIAGQAASPLQTSTVRDGIPQVTDSNGRRLVQATSPSRRSVGDPLAKNGDGIEASSPDARANRSTLTTSLGGISHDRGISPIAQRRGVTNMLTPNAIGALCPTTVEGISSRGAASITSGLKYPLDSSSVTLPTSTTRCAPAPLLPTRFSPQMGPGAQCTYPAMGSNCIQQGMAIQGNSNLASPLVRMLHRGIA